MSTSSIESLSPAQRRVLDEICKGQTARQIATVLGCSPKTVKNHTTRIFVELEARNRTDLVSKCARLGLSVFAQTNEDRQNAEYWQRRALLAEGRAALLERFRAPVRCPNCRTESVCEVVVPEDVKAITRGLVTA